MPLIMNANASKHVPSPHFSTVCADCLVLMEIPPKQLKASVIFLPICLVNDKGRRSKSINSNLIENKDTVSNQSFRIDGIILCPIAVN
jgi:hypothetical protein